MSSILVICALCIVPYAIRILLQRVFSVLDNIPGPPRASITTGNLIQFHDPDDWDFHRQLEESYEHVVKVHGMLGERHLFVFDPAALYSVLVQDQDIYEEPAKFLCLDLLMFGKGIFSTALDQHRKYRKIMVPAFSTANLRGMVPLFYDVAQRARDGLIAPHVTLTPQTLDLNSILRRMSLELIGRTGIGYCFDRMLPGEEPTDRYAEALKELFPTAFKMQLLIPLLPLLTKIFPPFFLRFMINVIPLAPLHELRDLVDITDATAAELVRDRKAAIASGKLEVDDGKDIMSLLVKMNAAAESGMHLTDDELVACTSMIMFAAVDTTSSSMNRISHVLAMYPDVQEKLRAEILSVPEQLDHDTLVGLPYLDGVVREVLRLCVYLITVKSVFSLKISVHSYPPVSPAMFREATRDAILPLSTPITGVDGKVVNSIPVPKGTQIYIAISAANHNKSIWGEDALEFKPERWTNGKANSVTAKLCGVYGNTMTFIGGGRSCIGFKFAQLEMKVALCVLLRAFKFSTPDPRIKWRMTAAVPAPHVDNQQQLPIVVERFKA
ncbi:cytochrome P450 [Mycena leptocephala]|nr:cytochrome P450 [Mycena leptocephala]